MRKLVFICTCLLWVSHVWSQDTIRIMTINIDQGAEATLQTLGEKIKSYNPDLVSVQEMDIRPNRGYAKHQRGKNFIAELCYHADMQGVFGKAWDHPGGWEYGDAILSKYSFEKCETFQLPHIEGTECRQLLLMHVNIKGHSICFGASHLCHANKENRAMQLKKIKKIMRKQKEKIQIVAGDFNSSIWENIVHPIMKNWADALPDKESTYSTLKDQWHYKAIKVDYILYNKALNKNIEVIHYSIDETDITDHCICVADLVIH